MTKIANIISCWTEDHQSYYPEKFPVEVLQNIREEIGSSDFANMYENKPVSSEDAAFKQDDLKYFTTIDKGIPLNTFITFDLGGKEKLNKNTPTGVAVVQIDNDDNWYVQVGKQLYLDLYDIMNEIFRLYNVWKPIKMGVEKEKYSIALKSFLDIEQKNRNIHLPFEELKIKINDRQSKEDRIMSLQPRIERGRLFIKKDQADLIDQLVRFPKGHLDILDALSRISQIAFPPRKKLFSYKRRPELDPIWIKTKKYDLVK